MVTFFYGEKIKDEFFPKQTTTGFSPIVVINQCMNKTSTQYYNNIFFSAIVIILFHAQVLFIEFGWILIKDDVTIPSKITWQEIFQVTYSAPWKNDSNKTF